MNLSIVVMVMMMMYGTVNESLPFLTLSKKEITKKLANKPTATNANQEK